jgi:glycosyltransferase involved in cell wall biosynthesis
LVGDGDTMQLLRRTSQFLQLEEQVIFTGRVPHDEVERYYSLIDIAPLPRKGYRVCELVSPLKPFEAMGAGKVLVTSSVRALTEIVDDGVTGLVFEKDNATDLAEKLELVLLDSGLRKKIGANANKWVRENHSWDVISKRVTNIYKQIWEEQK